MISQVYHTFSAAAQLSVRDSQLFVVGVRTDIVQRVEDSEDIETVLDGLL